MRQITKQQRRPNAGPINPFAGNALRDTLGNPKKGGAGTKAGTAGFSGNNTALKTVLGDPRAKGRDQERHTTHQMPPYKKQKISHSSLSYETSSVFFENGGKWLVARSRTAPLMRQLWSYFS